MPQRPPSSIRVAVRFPPHVTTDWRERCLASLAAAGDVEVTLHSRATGEIDLIVDFSAGPVDSRELSIPRLGYWTFVYGNEPERTAPGLLEFLGGGRAAYVRMVRLNRTNSATVLREGSVKVVGYSLNATRRRLLAAVVDWPGKLLKQTLRNPQSQNLPTVSLRQRGKGACTLLRAVLPIAWGRNVLRRIVQEMTHEHWAVGVIPEPVQEVYRSFDPTRIRWLPAPANGFLADPFGRVLADGTLVIMAEALSWQDGRGHIVAFESQPDGTLTPPEDVFTFNTHASYPQLIEHQGAIYCIPEIQAQRRVQLFRAEPFPHRWVPDAVLLEDFAGADATVYFHQERWWLFAGNHDDQDEAKLFVFHAPDLRGPWLPHAENPVKCDLRSARPAGPLFSMENDLYRPAQDCSATYGGAVVINRIERLTTDEFSEQPVRRLAPAPRGPYPHGLHTLSGAGNITLVDGKRHALSATALTTHLQRIRRQLGRRLNEAHRIMT